MCYLYNEEVITGEAWLCFLTTFLPTPATVNHLHTHHCPYHFLRDSVREMNDHFVINKSRFSRICMRHIHHKK